jgi:hypothetical protein
LFNTFSIGNIKGKFILIFTEYSSDLKVSNLDTFKIIIYNQEYNFENGQFIIKSFKLKTSFLKPFKPQIKLLDKKITLDIETRDINNKKVFEIIYNLYKIMNRVKLT